MSRFSGPFFRDASVAAPTSSSFLKAEQCFIVLEFCDGLVVVL